MVDKIRPLKIEDSTSGSSLDQFPTELDSTEDYVSCRGLSIQNSDNHLLDTSDNEFQFTDPVNGVVKLSAVIAGGNSDGALLGAETIDGTTNAIDTNIALYTVPTSSSAIYNNISICNRNNSTVSIRLAHIDGALISIADADYILYDVTFLPNEKKNIYIPGMEADDTILIRSDTTDVTFRITGIERSSASSVKRVAAYDISSAETNESAMLTTSKLSNLQYYICNRNASNSVTIRAALIDANTVVSLSDEDYVLYEETLTAGEAKGYDLGEGLLSAHTFMLRSSRTDVNIVIYGREYT